MLHKFRIKERKSEKLVLIQIHHEQLVSRRQIQLVGRELLVEVADIFTMFLYAPKSDGKKKNQKEKENEEERNVKRGGEKEAQWDMTHTHKKRIE